MNEQELIISVITAVTLILSGTIAGYITNKYAVRWLFKPVKLFGKQLFDVSILSTDEKQASFIDSLSDCVERRILTDEVIRKELINETMKEHLDDIVDTFISEALPESFKNIKLSEMEGFAETGASLKTLVSDVLDKNTDPLLVHVLEAINISEYVNETQIMEGTENLYDSMKHSFKNNYAVKDLLGRILTELLFSAMFHSEGRAALGKLTSMLFSGQGNPLGDLSSMTLPEKISLTLKKLISSGVSGQIKDKSANEYINDNSRKALAEKLEKVLIKKYEEKIAEISEGDISPMISSVTDNKKIKQTLSDMIFDYIDKNLNRLFSGKIKDTVKIALGRLDPDQLCDVAERLMKGELKYLSYFGGVLGFLISIPALLITLGNFAPSGFPQTFATLAFLIILMGFIGVITNVIAIKMFFRPYKKIEFLAKFRHTRCFSQGLILQNQKVFSHTLGEYIGTELLTSENIKKMLDSNKDAFISTLADNIMPYLLSYFGNETNRKNSAAKLSALLFNKASENKDALADIITNNLGSRSFGSIINLNDPNIRAKGVDLFSRFLDRLSTPPGAAEDDSYDYKFIAYALASLIKNNSSLKDKTWALIETFYMSEIADKNIGDYFSLPELSSSAQSTITKICQSDSAFDDFRKAAEDCISQIVDNSEALISPELTASISNKMAAAVFDTVTESMPSLMEDIHIADITEEKVASLEAEEIQNVVMSFAAPAFRSLYKLGSIGCVFGLNTYLAFILFIVDKLSDNKTKNQI
ncbi:MAG: DUF445 family protein [Clostridiales bacterium]|nr:DUF445 family protein [Clostridiales bacterium]